MKASIVLIGLPLALGLTPVEAAEWAYSSSGPNSQDYFDTSSVAVVDGYLRAWIKTVHETKQEVKASYPQKYYTENKMLSYFDCKAKRIVTTKFLSYDEAGNVVEDMKSNFSPKDFNDVVPESVGERNLDRVCKFAAARAGTERTGKKGKNAS